MRMKVRPRMWQFQPDHEPEMCLHIRYGGAFLVVRYADARRLVDLVHDEADRRDAELREGGTHAA